MTEYEQILQEMPLSIRFMVAFKKDYENWDGQDHQELLWEHERSAMRCVDKWIKDGSPEEKDCSKHTLKDGVITFEKPFT